MVTPEQRALEATTAAAEPPGLDAIWRALDDVPDPEIPAVSVLGLGIVRSVEWDADAPPTLVIKVTPTYSGCPATELIVASIRDALTELGVHRLRVETQLAPAWTTEWITPDARRKLHEFGIAPPESPVTYGSVTAPIDVRGISPLRRPDVVVPCPRCGSRRTQILSQFGSTACKAQYRCDDCLEPFDYFKRL
jgi:ring-1,2-phenylacetyl-CoA epoxidase subunit PaaD